jgi:eukaryotic-like serine/threonine-protein kinase
VEGSIVAGRYQLEGPLGEGSMGNVHRARHLELGKRFALKVISPAFADDQETRAMFNREAKLASEIAHPNIVSVVDFGEDPQLGAFMVMELVEGDLLLQPGLLPLSFARACDVLGQVADALEHVHRAGIVHGDVKAENIVLAEEQTVTARRRRIARLLDFGLARRVNELTEGEQLSGSPHYVAPERVLGGPPSIAADVYALGVLGFLVLTGSLPFDGGVLEVLTMHVESTAPPLAERRGQAVDEALEQLIARAMAKDPVARHASVAAFRYELNTVMDMLAFRRKSRPIAVIRADQPREEVRQPEIVGRVFEATPLAQVVIADQDVIARANEAFAVLLGEPVDEIMGLRLGARIPGLAPALVSARATQNIVQVRSKVFVPALGDVVPVDVWLAPIALDGLDMHVLVIPVGTIDDPIV